MSENDQHTIRPSDPVGRILFPLCRVLAAFGAFLCCVIAVMVTVTVTGRYLFAAPIPGDYDIIGIIAGCAIFAFLPYCQIRRANIVVDFFTTGMAQRGKAALDGFGTLLYLVVAALLGWRLYFGMVELRETSQVLAIVDFYRWWTVPFDLFCMAVLVMAIAYTLVQDIRAVRRAEPSASTDIQEP